MAASGEKASDEVQKADREKTYDLMIMDWKMPGMDGIEAAEQIKNNPEPEQDPGHHYGDRLRSRGDHAAGRSNRSGGFSD